MKFILNQQLFSIGSNFNIENEFGDKLFEVNGKIFTIGDKLTFKDVNGKIIFELKQKLFKIKDTYIIEKNNSEYAKIHKKMFTFFGEKFLLETPYGEIEAQGNFLDYDFKFYLNNNKIADVSKKFLSVRDKYIVDIGLFNEPELILAATVIIDMIVHNNKTNSTN